MLGSVKGPSGRNYAPKMMRLVELIVFCIFVVVAIKTAVYTVPADSAAVVKRFGKYNRTSEPGIYMMIPFGIEITTDVPVKRVQKEEFDFRTLKAGVDSRYLGVDEIDSGRLAQEELVSLIRESGERPSRSALCQRAKIQRSLIFCL